MERVPEPELMEESEQALAYAEADFSEANTLFVALFRQLVGEPGLEGQVVDLGCGPGDIPLRLARHYPRATFDLVDGSAPMLALARDAWTRAGLEARLRLIEARLPGGLRAEGRYEAVISNSLLHHLHEPAGLWSLVRDCARAGAPVLVMDLARPPGPEAWDALVEAYTAGAPEVLRRDFRNSLGAAFMPEEVRAQLRDAGLAHLEVRTVSDRHLAVAGRR